MSPEPVPGDAPEEDLDREAVRTAKQRRRRIVWSPGVILVIAAAFGLNLAGLGIVAWVVQDGQRRTAPAAAPATMPRPEPEPVTDTDRVEELLGVALRLERLGETESARRIRATAQALLLERNEEEGVYQLAVHLLDQGRPREARRMLYRILARADQPGTRWGELAVRARFLIGRTLAAEATRAENPGEEDS
jgi:hypothetical protein